jgi:flavin reductase (DIM6/NTAB) family NADH-FMN oxidoreductase RutF
MADRCYSGGVPGVSGREAAGGQGVAVDPFEFRTIIGHFATGVTVITTRSGDHYHGMTANAIASLSLDPVMVLICVEKTTHSHNILTRDAGFVINILGEHQEPLSRLFAKKSEPELNSLRGQAYRLGETGAPILVDCIAYIECRVTKILEGGDHSIFLGEVVTEGIVNENAKPLLFYRGGYHSLVS